MTAPLTATPAAALSLGKLSMREEFARDELETTLRQLSPLLTSKHALDLEHAARVGQLVAHGYAAVESRVSGLPAIKADEFTQCLERRLPVPPRFLAQCLRLVAVYGCEELQRLATVPELSLSHLLMLSRIPDDDSRRQLQQRVVDEQLTCDDLLREIRRTYRRQRAPGGGRKLAVPRSVKAALSNIAGIATTFASRSTSVWFGPQFDATAAIQSMPSAAFDDAFVEQLQETKAACQSVRDAANRDIAALETMAAHVERCRALYASEPALAEA